MSIVPDKRELIQSKRTQQISRRTATDKTTPPSRDRMTRQVWKIPPCRKKRKEPVDEWGRYRHPETEWHDEWGRYHHLGTEWHDERGHSIKPLDTSDSVGSRSRDPSDGPHWAFWNLLSFLCACIFWNRGGRFGRKICTLCGPEAFTRNLLSWKDFELLRVDNHRQDGT